MWKSFTRGILYYTILYHVSCHSTLELKSHCYLIFLIIIFSESTTKFYQDITCLISTLIKPHIWYILLGLLPTKSKHLLETNIHGVLNNFKILSVKLPVSKEKSGIGIEKSQNSYSCKAWTMTMTILCPHLQLHAGHQDWRVLQPSHRPAGPRRLQCRHGNQWKHQLAPELSP